MQVLVVGSTGGSGRAVVTQLLDAGHRVTAFSRRENRLGIVSDRLDTFAGDAQNPDDVERAVRGHEAVVVTLGISENPLRVRLFGPRHTPLDIRSSGTRNVIHAMQRHGVRRLVVLTSYGVGATRGRLVQHGRCTGWLRCLAGTQRDRCAYRPPSPKCVSGV